MYSVVFLSRARLHSPGSLDSEIYADIIRSVIFPFTIEKYNGEMFLHQDNDPKHSSKLCVKKMNELKINWVSCFTKNELSDGFNYNFFKKRHVHHPNLLT